MAHELQLLKRPEIEANFHILKLVSCSEVIFIVLPCVWQQYILIESIQDVPFHKVDANERNGE